MNTLSVLFVEKATEEQVCSLFDSLGAKIVQRLTFAKNLFVIQSDSPAETALALSGNPLCLFAEADRYEFIGGRV